MGGPWEKYQTNTKPWEKYQQEQQQPSGPSQLESGLRGAAQGATFGFGDELVGAGESTLGSLGIMPDKTYEQARDEARKANELAQEANPMSYGAGQLGGSVASSFLLPGAGATMGARAIQAAQAGAISGAGLADKPEDVVPDMAQGAAIGAITAPLGELGGRLVGKGLNKLGEFGGKVAEKLALKATGATGLQASKFEEGAGRELLDRGLVKFGDTPESIARNVGAAKEASGEAIGAAVSALDEQGGQINLDKVRTEIINKIQELRKAPGNNKIISQLEGELENLSQFETKLPISVGEQAKRNFQQQVNYASPEADKKVSAQMANVFKNQVEREAEALNPALASQFKEDKRLFGLYTPIEEAAQKRAITLNQSPIGGLLDAAAVVSGGGGLKGMAVAAGRRVLAPLSPASMAWTADKVSKLLQSNPQAFGKFAGSLSSAIARGPKSFAATHYLLQQQNPEYRQMVEKMNSEGQ